MKLFDIIGGSVAIHPDALGIPCFRTIWEKNSDKELARNIISYIVLNNHPDSPYVTSMYGENRQLKLAKELLPEGFEKDDDFVYAEETFVEFLDTLPLKLLRGLRNRMEAMSIYLETSPDDNMDMKMVKDTLAVAGLVDKAIKSMDSLEKQVRRNEMESSTVRGGSSIGQFELPRKK